VDEHVKPFRWNVAKREQLGRMVTDGYDGDYWWRQDEFQQCCARVLAFAGDRRVFFVGRSLESMFDYLSGALCDTSWIDRLDLFLFSMRYTQVRAPALSAMKGYMSELAIDPQSIARSAITLVDVVFDGETFSNLIELLHDWCEEDGVDWQAVRRNTRIIGVTQRTKTSPKTWRWQQQREAVTMLPPGAVKNVSLEPRLWGYLGDQQAKVTASYSPRRWGDEDVAHPDHNDRQLKGLQEAWHIFKVGCTPESRRRLTRAMAQTTGMQYEWFRHLLSEIN